MSARAAAAALAGALLLAALPGRADPGATPFVPLVVDLHVDQPWQVHWKERGPELSEGHTSTSALRAGGYGAVVFAIYLPDKPPKRKKGETSTVADAEGVYEDVRSIVRHARVFLPVRSPLGREGRVSTFLSIEGAGAFSRDPAKLEDFIRRGVRLVGLVHAADNDLGTSATGDDAKKHGGKKGLTALGKDFARRVYAAGALVDVSHLSDRGFEDVAAIAKEAGAPIVATHSNARAKAKHPRNLTDKQLQAIAASGGVVGLNFYAEFVSDAAEPTLAELVQQAEHMVKIMGADHVAIGSDFDGMSRPVKGMDDASKLPELAARLEKRGLPRADVVKLMATNALRVLGWRPTREIERRVEAARKGEKIVEDAPPPDPDEGAASPPAAAACD